MPTPEVMMALTLKLLGAFAGSALALVFVPPRTKRGFYRRVTASLIGGVIFGSIVRNWANFDKDWEGLIAGSCLAAFVAWWTMGLILRVLKAYNIEK